MYLSIVAIMPPFARMKRSLLALARVDMRRGHDEKAFCGEFVGHTTSGSDGGRLAKASFSVFANTSAL